MNPVEYAFSRLPDHRSYRIYSDIDVNGQHKERDYISPRYMGGDGLNFNDVKDQLSPAANNKQQGEGEDERFCICRSPYRQGQVIFQCEGPCQKWVHPHCFGETAEAIAKYSDQKQGIPYYCTFCRDDKEACKQTILF